MPITDAFTGTNGTGLPSYSASWTYVHGSGADLQIQSNGFTVVTSVVAACERTESPFADNHYAQVTISAFGADQILGVVVRSQGGTSANYYTYRGSSGGSSVHVMASGAPTILGSNAGGLVATDILRLSVSGTTITPNINGSTTNTPGAQTDATYSNGKPGVHGLNFDVGGAGLCDSFECSDTGVPVALVWISA